MKLLNFAVCFGPNMLKAMSLFAMVASMRGKADTLVRQVDWW